MAEEFLTVAQLRKLLADVPDDRVIHCQVVSTNGQAWNLCGSFGMGSNGKMAVLQMKHPDLARLPENAFDHVLT